MTRAHDLEMLHALLVDHPSELNEYEKSAFTRMSDSLLKYGETTLTPKQRAWVSDRFEQIVPAYKNLVSTGQAPRGKEVKLMVTDHPLRPPKKVKRDPG